MIIKDYKGFEISANREGLDFVTLVVIRNSDYWILDETFTETTVRETIRQGRETVDDYLKDPDKYNDSIF